MQKKSIAVVTAPNMRFVNTGMTTVELAAKRFLEKVEPEAAVNFFSIVPPNPSSEKRWMMMDLGAPHSSAKGVESLFKHNPIYPNIDELFGHDLILYWGDFLQARHYIDDECVNRTSEIYGISTKESQDFCYLALLQEAAPLEVHRKSILFGSSLLYNKASDYKESRYSSALRSLLTNSQAALFRDPISSVRANHLTKNYALSHLGIDPAFLNDTDAIARLPSSKWSTDLLDDSAVGLFFGTRTSAPSNLISFCSEIAGKLNASLEWLPWFPLHEKMRQESTGSLSSRFKRFNGLRLRDIEALLPRGDSYSQGDLLTALPKYKLIITDTYHLCINAWRAGTPAICVGAEINNPSQVIKDFKKRVLYEMFDAQEFYFDVSAIEQETARQRTIARMSSIAVDTDLIARITERIQEQTHAVETILRDKIEKVLAHP